jgi:hypothetical protein
MVLSRRRRRRPPPPGQVPLRHDGSVVIVRATRKLLQRLERAPAAETDESTTLRGDWYAALLPWRPRQVALLVNEPHCSPS